MFLISNDTSSDQLEAIELYVNLDNVIISGLFKLN